MDLKKSSKTPRSAYLFFCDKYKKDLTQTSWSAKAKELGRLWKLISPEEKQIFEYMAKEDRERYEKENGHKPKRGGLDLDEEPEIKKENGSRFPKRSVTVKRLKSESEKNSKASDSESFGDELFEQVSNNNNNNKKRVTRSKKKNENSKRIFKYENPLGPFILFSKEIRPLIKNSNPNLELGEIGKIISDQWRILNEEKKENFRIKAKKLPLMEVTIDFEESEIEEDEIYLNSFF